MKLIGEPKHLYFKINKPEFIMDFSGINIDPRIYNIDDAMIEIGIAMINYFLSSTEDCDYLFEHLDVNNLVDGIVNNSNEIISDSIVINEEDSNFLDVLYLRIFNVIESNRIGIVAMIGEIKEAIKQLLLISNSWKLFVYNVNFIKGDKGEYRIHAIVADPKSGAVW